MKRHNDQKMHFPLADRVVETFAKWYTDDVFQCTITHCDNPVSENDVYCSRNHRTCFECFERAKNAKKDRSDEHGKLTALVNKLSMPNEGILCCKCKQPFKAATPNSRKRRRLEFQGGKTPRKKIRYRFDANIRPLSLHHKNELGPIVEANKKALGVSWESMDKNGTWFLAMWGGKVVGGCMVDKNEDKYWVYNLVVDQDHRKRGVGTRLVENAASHVKTVLYLECNDGSLRPFYEKLLATTVNLSVIFSDAQAWRDTIEKLGQQTDSNSPSEEVSYYTTKKFASSSNISMEVEVQALKAFCRKQARVIEAINSSYQRQFVWPVFQPNAPKLLKRVYDFVEYGKMGKHRKVGFAQQASIRVVDSPVHGNGVVAGEDTHMGSWIPYVAKPSTNTASEYAVTVQNVEYDVLPGMEKTAGHFVNEVPEDPLFLVYRVACQLAYFPKHLERIDCKKAIRACRENAVLVRGLFTDMYVPLVTFGEFSGHIYVKTDAGEVRVVFGYANAGEAVLRNMHKEVFPIPSTASTDGFMSIVLMIPPGPSWKPGLNLRLTQMSMPSGEH